VKIKAVEENMKSMLFKAYAVANEIDLNKIAEKCNIPRKYTWEEPLVLSGGILSSIINKEPQNGEQVMVFSFGSVVFINMDDSLISLFFEYLKSFKPDLELDKVNLYTDDFELHIGESSNLELNDKYAAVPEIEIFHPELVSTVLAKSVALEKTEEHLGNIVDKLENMIDRLEKGSLRISNKELARTTAKIVRHEYNTISYIMILDKPDITWTNSMAEYFYEKMSEFFELNDRFEILKKKTDILNSILDGFSSLSHSIRGLFVEWIIVVLIAIEIILMAADLLF